MGLTPKGRCIGMSKTKRRGPTIKPRETYIDARELERIKDEAVKDAVSAMTGVLIACQISVMKKHYGWGKRVRLPRVAGQVFEEWKYFNQSGMTPNEYIDSIGRITGINVDVTLR